MVHLPPADDTLPEPGFTPVAVRPRRDGWTPAVQAEFIAALVGGDSVAAACRRVGRSPKSAYALRARTDAAGFAAAWDGAIADIAGSVGAYALDRLRTPAVRPVFYRGRRVGERVVHDDRLLMTMLARSAPRGADAAQLAARLADLEHRLKVTLDERFGMDSPLPSLP